MTMDLVKAADRAKVEGMDIIPMVGDWYTVYTDKGTEYGVVTDTVGKTNTKMIVDCSCPHRSKRGNICKHMVKVSMNTGLPLYMG